MSRAFPVRISFRRYSSLLIWSLTPQVNIVVTIIATLNANLCVFRNWISPPPANELNPSFYTWRIHKMSKQNWWITGPIVRFLAGCRK